MPNFLALEKKYSNYKNAKYCILPIPYERTTSYGKGTQFGPEAVIKASEQVELFDEELENEPFHAGICTLEKLQFDSKKTKKEALQSIFEEIKQPLKNDKFVVSLGGEHSITFPLVRAYLEKYQDLSILQLDAHADLRKEYMGSSDNHACVMARVNELTKVVGVGIRSLSKEERDWIKKDHLPIWFAHQMHNNSDWIQSVLEQLNDTVYITFDVDFFDPSIMPSTGTPEPSGFYWRETLNFLKQVFLKKEVVGCDIVELAPQPGFSAPDFMIARLIYKMIGFHDLSNDMINR